MNPTNTVYDRAIFICVLCTINLEHVDSFLSWSSIMCVCHIEMIFDRGITDKPTLVKFLETLNPPSLLLEKFIY